MKKELKKLMKIGYNNLNRKEKEIFLKLGAEKFIKDFGKIIIKLARE